MSDPATREEVAALRLEIAATKTEIFKWLVGAALFFQAIISRAWPPIAFSILNRRARPAPVRPPAQFARLAG